MFWDSFDMGNPEPSVDPLAAIKTQLAVSCVTAKASSMTPPVV